jgi:hypothetical protein
MDQTQATSTPTPINIIDQYCRQEAETAALAKRLAASFGDFLANYALTHGYSFLEPCG